MSKPSKPAIRQMQRELAEAGYIFSVVDGKFQWEHAGTSWVSWVASHPKTDNLSVVTQLAHKHLRDRQELDTVRAFMLNTLRASRHSEISFDEIIEDIKGLVSEFDMLKHIESEGSEGE